MVTDMTPSYFETSKFVEFISPCSQLYMPVLFYWMEINQLIKSDLILMTKYALITLAIKLSTPNIYMLMLTKFGKTHYYV